LAHGTTLPASNEHHLQLCSKPNQPTLQSNFQPQLLPNSRLFSHAMNVIMITACNHSKLVQGPAGCLQPPGMLGKHAYFTIALPSWQHQHADCTTLLGMMHALSTAIWHSQITTCQWQSCNVLFQHNACAERVPAMHINSTMQYAH
jgi:hypothetical protein